jgi:hypothetical protein
MLAETFFDTERARLSESFARSYASA